MKKRRVEVLIETRRTWIIKQPGTTMRAWCPECARTTQLVTADEAARVVGQSTRAIFTWIEARRLHYRETPDRRVLICFDSLCDGAAAPAHRVPDICTVLERDGDLAPET